MRRLLTKIKTFFVKLLLECVDTEDRNKTHMIHDEDSLFHEEVRKHGKE